jgi:hypothetical protein
MENEKKKKTNNVKNKTENVIKKKKVSSDVLKIIYEPITVYFD